MAYKQKNNPFAQTSCGRRRNYMTVGNTSPVKKDKKLSKEVIQNYDISWDNIANKLIGPIPNNKKIANFLGIKILLSE